MKNLSSSLEDYLEIIYELFQEQQKVRPVDIVKRLNYSRASVTEALQKLASLGYINYGHYQPIELTEKGIEIAKSVSNKHQILYSFFKDILGVDKEESSQNACKIEHLISEDALQRLISFIEYCKENDNLENFKDFYKYNS